MLSPRELVTLVQFKSKQQENDFNGSQIWPLLKAILLDADNYSKANLNADIVVTSIIRSYAEDIALHGSGIHCTGRAGDVRIKAWDDPNALAIAAYLNGKYLYDPARTTLKVAFMEPHGDGPHIHCQVHARTTQIN